VIAAALLQNQLRCRCSAMLRALQLSHGHQLRRRTGSDRTGGLPQDRMRRKQRLHVNHIADSRPPCIALATIRVAPQRRP